MSFKNMRMIAAIVSVLSFVAVASSAQGAPIITNPTPGSTLSGSSVTLSLSKNGTDNSHFFVYVGSAKGQRDYFSSSGAFTQLSHTVTGLPTDGETVHVRLWYWTGAWSFVDFQYTAYQPVAAPAADCPCFTGGDLDSLYDQLITSQGRPVSCMERDNGAPEYPPYTEYYVFVCDNPYSCDLPSDIDAGVSAGFGSTGDTVWQAGCSVIENGQHHVFDGNLTRGEVKACSDLFKASSWGQTCQ